MSTKAASFSIEPGAEPIPGYRLEKRIGAGGYGEVWKATAPGGLPKALKIIHGQIDGSRALREMRSLDRAKSLNHPFLLSLERIEIVDGHLIIVSELADATLKDRFEQCRAGGLTGIPRDELLEYMREAADALDYLFDSHALQHLDVKPENLLLVGKHIKVADFGLLKDLQESRASLVNGMTPRYSSPEMFGGKPGRNSDQYSLAIVYQEMLSGRLPFPGTNIAALASQHLNSPPDLAELAPLERFAVGKALSKDPRHRFPSCRAFVERLMHRGSAAIATEPFPAARTASGAGGARRSAEASPGRSGFPPIHDGQTVEIAAPEIRSLPRLQAVAQVTYRPAIFIGIGEMGGRILGKLRQLLSDRIGEAKALAALQFLYVDTDTDAIRGIAAGPWTEGLREDEILIMPLRQTQDYRAAVVSNLDSISRRWIYNVPRSLRTQGLRALGRISLLDHSARLLNRLREAVGTCASTPSVMTTAEETGLPFCESDPRVFVVASITGGTGGGMVIDAGYAIRQVLAECGFTDDDVCGVLTYGISRGSQKGSFAAASAYACLDELRYFAQPGCDYPGERTCGLAGFREDGPTFRNTYLFDFGEDAGAEDFAAATELVSEYLFLSTVSTASAALDQCRRLERETPSGEPLRIRTAGMCPFAAATRGDPGPYAELLCRSLVRRWKVGMNLAADDDRVKLSDVDRLYEACDPQRSIDSRVSDLAQCEMDRLAINLRSLAEGVVRIASEKLNADPASYLRNVVRDSLKTTSGPRSQGSHALEVTLRRIQTIVGLEEDLATHRESQVESLADILLPQAQAMGARRGESVASWILGLVDVEHARVDGARQVATWCSEYLRSLQRTALEQLQAAQAELQLSSQAVAVLVAKARQSRGQVNESTATSLQGHSARLLSVLVHQGVCKALRTIDPCLTFASDQIRELWKDLTQLAEEFQAPSPEVAATLSAPNSLAPSNEPQPGAAPGPAPLPALFMARQKDLIEELDREIETRFFKADRRLRQILTQGSELRKDLIIRMRASARKVILRACNEASHSYLRDALAEGGDAQLMELMRKCLTRATPSLLTLGGGKRLLMVVPSKLDIQHLARELEHISNDPVNVVFEKQTDLKICYEVENVRWDGIQARLLRQRHDNQELASRLHTRINVEWTVV